MPRGETLRRQSRKMVYDVYTYMSQEAKEGVQNVKKVQVRTAAATKTSVISVKRIVKEANSSGKLPTFRTPGKKRSRQKPLTDVDDFDKGVIKRCIHNFHNTNKELPTLNKILAKLRDEIAFRGSKTSLRRILKDLGFRWRRTENHRKILIEKSNIRLKRIEYLQKVRKYRQAGRPIVYTAESYMHSTLNTSCNDSDKEIKKPIVKGQRVVIVQAGCESGSIPNALLTFKSGLKTGDNHQGMNFEIYQKWLRSQLIPNLPPNAVVVVDNASYKEHESAPSSSAKKADMQSWLTQKGIPYTPDMLKPQLYKLIKIHKSQNKTFSIDKILSEHGHEVLRLPPYHPDLNPVEMAWDSIKGYVNSKNVQWDLNRVIELVTEKANQMGPNVWKARCDVTKKIEDSYIESDHIIDNLTETELIMRLGDSSDSESGDSGSSASSSDENDDMSTPGTCGIFYRVDVPGCGGVPNDDLHPDGESFIDSDSD